MTSDAAERLRAFQRKQEGVEVVQNRIARRIGDDGWLVLGEMSDAQRARLSTLERQGRLDDETLGSAVLAIRYMRPPWWRERTDGLGWGWSHPWRDLPSDRWSWFIRKIFSF